MNILITFKYDILAKLSNNSINLYLFMFLNIKKYSFKALN